MSQKAEKPKSLSELEKKLRERAISSMRKKSVWSFFKAFIVFHYFPEFREVLFGRKSHWSLFFYSQNYNLKFLNFITDFYKLFRVYMFSLIIYIKTVLNKFHIYTFQLLWLFLWYFHCFNFCPSKLCLLGRKNLRQYRLKTVAISFILSKSIKSVSLVKKTKSEKRTCFCYLRRRSIHGKSK